VEALGSLRLLSGTASTAWTAPAFDHAPTPTDVPSHAPDSPETNGLAWDVALEQADVGALLSNSTPTIASPDPGAIRSGLTQLDRYLGRTWSRAGIAPQQHDDSTQAVYTTLLQTLGRDRFEVMVAVVGLIGIREVLSRETADGLDFFRAIDAAKKRALRERNFQPLEGQADPVDPDRAASSSLADRRGALHEAIARRLSPREAALIHETLKGSTPAEIAQQWGVAPKTVSNEKTRVLAKLRDALAAELAD
jgi:DNA-binding CsgD family transcriptional regulator